MKQSWDLQSLCTLRQKKNFTFKSISSNKSWMAPFTSILTTRSLPAWVCQLSHMLLFLTWEEVSSHVWGKLFLELKEKSSILFSLISWLTWFSHSLRIREKKLFSFLESTTVLHQNNRYLIKQIKRVHKNN